MITDALENVRSAISDTMVPNATATQPDADEHDYPDRLNVALLRIAGVCGLASVMAVLDTTVVAVAQRTFVTEFASTQAVAAWTMAGYMLALATVIPITGWATDRFGTKRLFMSSVLVFTLGSLLCAISPNILLLIASRVLQGIGGGMLLPLGFVISSREAGPKRLGRLMALGGIPLLIAPIGGPTLSGWLIDAWGWQWIFLINLPVGLAAFALAALWFPKDRPVPSEKFDLVGVLLLSPGVAILLLGVSCIPAFGTVADRRVLILTILGLALIAGFVVHALYRADNPLIDLRLFKNRVVTQVNVTVLVFTIAYFGTMLLVPSYFQQVLHETPMQSGVHMAPQALGAMLTMPFAGTFVDKRGPGKIVLVGVMLITTGLGIFTFGVTRQLDYVPTLLAGQSIMGMGIGCTLTPLSAAVVQSLRPHQIARATTLISVNQQVAASIGAALMAVTLTSQFNRSENISAANKLESLRQKATATGIPVDPSAIPQQSLAPGFSEYVLHDLSRAYVVVFVLAVALGAFTIIPASFLPKKRAIGTVGE